MAKKNYDDYGYDNDYTVNSGGLIKKAIMVVMIIVAIILIIYLIKGCTKKSSGGKNKPNIPDSPSKTSEVFNFENVLLDGGKRHFEAHKNELPSTTGECSVVELETLLSENLLNSVKFESCNVNKTYVKVCAIDNSTYQYTPWINCGSDKSDNKYDQIRVGTLKDVIADSTYVEFKFLPQEVQTSTSQNLGKVEELWKDDIKYESFKTLSSTKYYRYRDKLYIWELISRKYYTSDGIKNSASETTEYYKTSPNSNYKLSSDKTTSAYKWYKSSSRREYYMVNGSKMPSTTAVGEYNIRDPYGFDATRYRTRTVTGTYSPKKYYACSTSSTSPIIKYQQVPCGQGISPEFNYQREVFYTCEENLELIRDSQRVSAGTRCNRYSSWGPLTTTPCNTSNKNLCESYTLTFYYWYKNIDDVRTYYPSGSSSASGEKVYFVSEPFKGAIKDTSTRATAYKWYNENIQMSSTYSATAPTGYTSARKTGDYKYTDWSTWSTHVPSSAEGRSIETKTKIKLQQILGQTSTSWKNLKDEYVSEEELIKVFKDKGYKVNTLEDILNNGQIRYEMRLFVRNKKESK